VIFGDLAEMFFIDSIIIRVRGDMFPPVTPSQKSEATWLLIFLYAKLVAVVFMIK